MVSKTVAYGALALAASEMTGVTNLSGASGQNSPIQMPDIKLPDMSAPNVSIEETGSDGTAAIAAALAETENPVGSETVSALASLQNQNASLQEQIINLRERTNTSELPNLPNLPTRDGPGSQNQDGSNNQTSSLNLQDYGTPQDGDLNIGDGFALLGESGKAAGEGVDATIDTLTTTGSTVAETTRALAGKRFNTEGTFANNGKASERRLYEGSLIDKATGALGL